VTGHTSTSADRRNYWNARYRKDPRRFGDEPNVFVAEILGGAAPGRVLDVASGRGRNAVWLASRGHEVTAIDISDVGIETGRAIAESRGVRVEWVHEDFLSWDVPERAFDIVLLSYLQLPPEDRKEAHGRAVAALADEGRLVLVAHHKANIEEGFGGPDDPAVLYDEDILASDFASLSAERNERVLRPVDGSIDAIDIVFVGRLSLA
jgi:SAM-dependent methyltransferase